MALRVGGARPAPPVEEEMPVEEMPVAEEASTEEPMPEEMPAEEPPMEEPAGGLVDPAVAGYKGPEMGPFQCGTCQYYAGEGTCMILAAPVDEAGLCNLFVTMAESEEDAPMEEEMPAEMPEELPEEPVEE